MFIETKMQVSCQERGEGRREGEEEMRRVAALTCRVKRKSAHHFVSTSGIENEATIFLRGKRGKGGKGQGMRDKGSAGEGGTQEGRGSLSLEAQVQVAAHMDPEFLSPNSFRFADLVHGLVEGGVAHTERGPHGEVSVHEMSLEGVGCAGEDREQGVGEGARVQLRGSPEHHRVVPVVGLE
jgi:hypothetical protein